MKKYLSILILGLTFVQCSSTKYVKEEALLYYGKTQCLRSCPVFDMYIFEDGKVLYEGVKNTTPLGKQEYTVKPDDIKKIKQVLEKVDFEAKDKLTRDLPNTILKFKGNTLISQDIKQLKELIILLEKIKK